MPKRAVKKEPAGGGSGNKKTRTTSGADSDKTLNLARVGNGQLLLAMTTYGVVDFDDRTSIKDAFTSGLIVEAETDDGKNKLEGTKIKFESKVYIRVKEQRNDNETVKNKAKYGIPMALFYISMEDSELAELDHDKFMANTHKILGDIIFGSDEKASQKNKITILKRVPDFTKAMDFTGVQPDGSPKFDKLDKYVTDNICLGLFVDFNYGNSEYTTAENVAGFAEFGDNYNMFTDYGKMGYARGPVEKLGFPVKEASPPEEFHTRLQNIRRYQRDHADDDDEAAARHVLLLSELSSALTVKAKITPATKALINDALDYFVAKEKSPSSNFEEGAVAGLATLLRKFDNNGKKKVSGNGQQEIDEALALQTQKDEETAKQNALEEAKRLLDEQNRLEAEATEAKAAADLEEIHQKELQATEDELAKLAAEENQGDGTVDNPSPSTAAKRPAGNRRAAKRKAANSLGDAGRSVTHEGDAANNGP